MIQVFPTPAELADHAAQLFAETVTAAITENGRAIVALSGGSTPKLLHARLIAEPNVSQIDWSKITFLWGDDRYVPATDPQSNEGMARETLLDHLPTAPAAVLPMYQGESPEADAAAYERSLLNLFQNEPPIIDLLLLGMGGDGHTLSLFPGEPGVHENARWVIAAKAPVNAPDRITLTPVLANSAAKILFLVAGADKADALTRCLEGPINYDETPSQAIARVSPNVTFLVDQAAARNLS